MSFELALQLNAQLEAADPHSLTLRLKYCSFTSLEAWNVWNDTNMEGMCCTDGTELIQIKGHCFSQCWDSVPI